jgi:hypothetical protein
MGATIGRHHVARRAYAMNDTDAAISKIVAAPLESLPDQGRGELSNDQKCVHEWCCKSKGASEPTFAASGATLAM